MTPERTETAGPFINGPECPNCPHQMTFHTRQGKCHATISGAACPCVSTERTETAGAVEVRECWALRWSDGTVSGGMYSSDGSDYAEQTVRSFGGGAEVVRRTVTITRTPWEAAP